MSATYPGRQPKKEPAPEAASSLCFGAFEFIPTTGELKGKQETVRLQPQPAAVLTALLNASGQLVSRETLRDLLWPDSEVEFDQSLGYCIRTLRRALGDRAASPKYIETLPRRGFRFVAPINAAAETVAAPWPRPLPRGARWWAVGVLVLVLIPILATTLWSLVTSRDRLVVLPFRFGLDEPGLAEVSSRVQELITLRLTERVSDRYDVLGPASFQPGSKAVDRETALDADARVVVSGSLRFHGDQVAVFAQMVRNSDGRHLWAARATVGIPEIDALAETFVEKILATLEESREPQKNTSAPPRWGAKVGRLGESSRPSPDTSTIGPCRRPPLTPRCPRKTSWCRPST